MIEVVLQGHFLDYYCYNLLGLDFLGMKEGKKKILFLCTGNSCRSQMAEGWTRSLKGDEY